MIPDALFPALMNQLFQVSCVAVFAAVVTRWSRGSRPHLVHAVWLIVFLKCITPPIVASPTSPFSWLQAALVGSEGYRGVSKFYVGTSDIDSDKAQALPLETSLATESAESGNDSGELWWLELWSAWQSVRRVASSLSAVQLLLLSWLLVAVAIFSFLAFRFMTFLRRVNRTKLRGASCDQYSSRLNGLVAKIEVKLGMRQRARVEVVDALIGPAIVGLFSPTILLPKVIIDRTSDKHLEALIAHELVHFRRGDLWWSALQTLAVCCYWFHPLVWLARSVMNREAEKCCDEETIGSLKCEPGEYARCLISVLECKHLLRAVPLLPGVRPVDITAKRLERIMRLRHGCYSRCPRWVRITMVVGAIILLPGATLTLAQQEEKSGYNSLQAPSANTDDSIRLPQPAFLLPDVPVKAPALTNNGSEDSKYELELIDITEYLKKSKETEEMSLEQAEANLVSRFPWTNSLAVATFGIGDSDNLVTLGGDSPRVRVIGNRLYALGTDKERSSIRNYLDHYRKFGNQYLVYEVRILDLPTKSLDALGIRWDADQATYKNSEPNGPAKSNVVTASFESKPASVASKMAQVDTAEIKTLLACDGCNILMAPKIATLNAQLAQLHCGSTHPFVVGHKPLEGTDGKPNGAFQPEIELVESGLKVELEGTVMEKDPTKLALKLKFTQAKILDVSKFTLVRDGEEQTIQQPSIKRRFIETQLKQELGSTIAIAGEAEQVETLTESGLPILSKIPYVNRMFKNTAKHSELRTQVVLVTCRLVNGAGEEVADGTQIRDADLKSSDSPVAEPSRESRPSPK